MFKHHFNAIYQYRDFIFASIKRDFEIRYLRSLLGASWTFIHPLALILIYTVVFSRIMQARLVDFNGPYAYSIYLCSGLIFWGLFAEIVLKAQMIFLEQANLLKKINFPRICLPIVVAGNGLISFLIIFCLFLAFLALIGAMPGLEIFTLIPITALTVLFAVALGTCLGILNVFFRDVGHLFGVLLQFWFWLTPIVYPVSILPQWAQDLMELNPLANIVQAAQAVLLGHTWPDWRSLTWATTLALFITGLAAYLYLRHGAEMQDEL